MTKLPRWAEDLAKESGASRADFTPKLIQALMIACTALEKAKRKADGISVTIHRHVTLLENVYDIADKAMRQIEELGQ